MIAAEFRNVAKCYEGKPILNQYSLSVAAEERLVLFGPSGCGKTTVLRHLAGFVAPDEGAVLLQERVVAERGIIRVPPEERDVGMVFQDLALWPHLTVAANLEFGLKARGVPKVERTTRIAKMLERVRLGDFASQYPTRLSGGQQQRVAIARALVTRPSLLLMDEPLANLDETLRDEIVELLLQLHRDLRFTLVYVTHNRREIESIASRSVLLQPMAKMT